MTIQDELTVPLCDSVNNVISVPLEGFRTQCIPAELAWSGVTDGLE